MEERTESYGHSKIIAKKVIELDGGFVEVRLMEIQFGGEGGKINIIPRARWATRTKKAEEELSDFRERIVRLETNQKYHKELIDDLNKKIQGK